MGSQDDVARDAAEHAVKKVFAILGVDVDVPKEIEDFRKDLRFGSSMRKIGERSTLAMVGIIAAGAVVALWYGIIAAIKGHP